MDEARLLGMNNPGREVSLSLKQDLRSDVTTVASGLGQANWMAKVLMRLWSSEFGW